jgi:hypothetical protein
VKRLRDLLHDPNAHIPPTWLEQLRRAVAEGPEHAALYDALFEKARFAGVDKLVQLLDTVDAPTGFGHGETRASGKAIDAAGRPMPWITYPAFHYLDQLDLSTARVLETGAGNSTLYWGERAREVVTIEHDPKWRQWVTADLPSNCRVVVTDESQYAQAFAAEVAADGFDVIVIDGRERYACTRAAVGRVNAGGFVVLDNSEWYPNCAAALRESGLIEVDFAGLGPVVEFSTTTSLFLHPEFRPKPRALPFPRVSPGQQMIDASDDWPSGGTTA